ncbi:MAG: hypothetical protein GDA41_04170 [Rhodospirillales bacterium]|nr:hypothetical protein [Rhodospirillales bacterium]
MPEDKAVGIADFFEEFRTGHRQQAVDGPRAGCRQCSLPTLVVMLVENPQRLGQELLLGIELEDRHALAQAGLFGDCGQGGSGQTVLYDRSHGRVDDLPLPPIGALRMTLPRGFGSWSPWRSPSNRLSGSFVAWRYRAWQDF